MSDPKNPPEKPLEKTQAATPRKARVKRETASVDAQALYPLPPDHIDEKKVVVLSEQAYGDKTVQVVTDGKGVWKEVV